MAGFEGIAANCSGVDLFGADPGLQYLLAIYLPGEALDRLTPHFERLGKLASGRLDNSPHR